MTDDPVRLLAEKCSSPGASVPNSALLYMRPYVESYLDPVWLEGKLKQYDSWATDNSDGVLRSNFLHRDFGFNVLAAAIWSSRYWEDIHESDPSFPAPAGAQYLLHVAIDLAVLELNAGAALDAVARISMQKRMHAADHVWGLIHECRAFGYLVRCGVPVEPMFLQDSSHDDILARWKGETIPVQCKCMRPGTGRLISRDVFTTLAGSIARDAKLRTGGRLMIRIRSTGKITQEHAVFLRKEIGRGAGTNSRFGEDLLRYKGRLFSVKTDPLAGEVTAENARQFLENEGFHHSLLLGDPKPDCDAQDADIVIGIAAQINEGPKPWLSLRRQILRAAAQLDGGPSGIVAVHYSDPVDEFESLRPGDRRLLQEIAELIHPLPHVAAVFLSSEPDLQIGAEGLTPWRRYSNPRLPVDFPAVSALDDPT